MLVVSRSMHEACYSFRGAAEGGKLKAKKHSTTMHQVKVEVVAMYMLESNMFNRKIQRMFMPKVLISLTKTTNLPPVQDINIAKHGTSSRIGAIHKRDLWCFHEYPCD